MRQCMATTAEGRQCAMDGETLAAGVAICHWHRPMISKALAWEWKSWLMEEERDELRQIQAEARRLRKMIARAGRRSIPKPLRLTIIQRDCLTCSYCRRVGNDELGPDGRRWHIDHIHPVIEGGDNEPSNLALACASCNLRKHATSAEDFRESLEEMAA